MEKEEIKIETPIAVAGVTIVPIVKTSLRYRQIKNSFSSFVIKQPVNLVVISPQGNKAFSITGEEISFNQLTEEMPEIEEILKEI